MERKTVLAAVAAALALIAGGYGLGRARGDAGGGAPRGDSRPPSGAAAARVADAPDGGAVRTGGADRVAGSASRPDRVSTPSGAESRLAAAPFSDAAASRTVDSVLVYGVVRATDGDAVQQAFVDWTRVGEERARSVEVDRKGAYAAHLPPGEWRVRVRGRGIVDAGLEVALAPDEPRVRRDLEVRRRYVVNVFAVDEDGRPLEPPRGPPVYEDALGVVASRIGAPPMPPGALDARRLARGALGSFLRKEGPDGRVGTFEADEAPPFALTLCSGSAPLATRTVEAGAREVRFEVTRAALAGSVGALRVRLVDAETGRPIADRPTTIDLPYASGPAKKTDADGVVVFADVSPGPYRFETTVVNPSAADEDPYAMDARCVVVVAGRTTDLGDFPLTRRARVRGRVEDAGPKDEIVVRCADADAAKDALDLHGFYTGSLGENGEFALSRAPKGRLVLVAYRSADSAFAATTVDASGGAVDGVRLRFGAARAVRITPRGPWPGTLAVDAADGTPYVRRTCDPGYPYTIRLPVGAYRVRFGAAERAFEVGTADVALEIGP